MATALKHKQRSSRSYQKNHKTMGAAIPEKQAQNPLTLF